jgi:hypothetical protein
MKTLSINKFITNYPERIILFVCSIILLVIFFVCVLGKKEDLNITAVKENLNQLSQAIERNEPETFPRVTYLEKIKGNWENMPLLIEGESWLMYRQPVIVVKFEKLMPPKITKKNLPPIIKNIQNVRESYEITLIWDRNKDSTAQIKSYLVYRRSQEEKDFNRIDELFITSITYTDNVYIYSDQKIRSETEYFYYITAFSDEQDVNKKESEPSNTVTITTFADYEIEFKSVENDLVYTKIIKYLNGKWESQSYNVKRGDKIGKGEFSTECIILDVQPYEIEGKEIGPGQVSKIKTFKIIYLDKNKKEYNYIIKP